MGKKKSKGTGDDGYDPRANPERGVRIEPLPVECHPAFRRFVESVVWLIQSHTSTWQHAKLTNPNEPMIDANLVYWYSCRRFMNYLEYLGTSNDPAKRHGAAGNRGEGRDRDGRHRDPA